jgi:AcrR family transcriptional regulator
VEIADADGLDAVSMRSVAGRLGAGAMSLYSYVPHKRALVREMLEQVSQAHLVLPAPSGEWRADVHLLARRQRELALRHPWLVDAVSPSTPLGPGTLAYLEFALGALEPTGLDAAACLETAALITGFVLNLVRTELAEQAAVRRGPEDAAVEAARLNGLLACGRYPRFAAAIGTSYLEREPFDPAAEFERLLDRILDGLVPLPGRPPTG